MNTVELTLLLLAVVALTAAIGKRLSVPTPLLFIAAGIGLSFFPGLQRLDIEPSIFFVLFIPPLLFADGWLIPKRDLVRVLRPVLLLAFGLVFMTIFSVGVLMHWLVPGLPLAAAFALGAIVSPTDAVATSAMVGGAGLPVRTRRVIEGESLINDASGLVGFRLALAALVTGTFSWLDATLDLFFVAAGGVLAGGAVAWIIGALRVALRNREADQPSIQTVLSVLTPFAAWLVAEHLELSGILAVVVAGLYAGWNDFRTLDARTRRHSWEVWAMLLFVFNGVVFVLLGISLAHVLARLPDEDWPRYLAYAAALWAALTALRLAWTLSSSTLTRLFPGAGRKRDLRAATLVGWAGLRGSITMAAALSLPVFLPDGQAFPHRDLLVFLAASAILLTLTINGLSLPLLVRALNLPGDDGAARDRHAAEIAVARAATAALEQEIVALTDPEDIAHARGLAERYSARVDELADTSRAGDHEQRSELTRRLMLVAMEAQRRELYTLRDAGSINDETLRDIESRLDNAELVADEAAPMRQP